MINEIIEKVELHKKRAKMALKEIKSWDKLEKFEIVDDASKWIKFRKLRNELTNEYPDDESSVIEGIKIAINSFSEIEKILKNIIDYLSKRDILK